MKRNKTAFTLVEMIIVVAVLGILASLAIPTVLDARNKARAASAGAACRAIETAKNLWKKDYPGATIPSKEALNQYFPGNSFPADPWGVIGIDAFENVTDLNKVTEHIFNGDCRYEPISNCSPTTDADGNRVADIEENGYNDAAQPQ